MSFESNASGIKTLKQVSTSRSLSTVINPSKSLAIVRVTDRPKPVAAPIFLVIKNGSKILSRTDASMGWPVSVTAHHKYRPALASLYLAISVSVNSTDSQVNNSVRFSGIRCRHLDTGSTIHGSIKWYRHIPSVPVQ